MTSETEAEYDAFISYGHAHDKDLAESIEKILTRLGRSWRKPYALRVFRDETGMALGQLWQELEKNLDRSRHLVLLASPQVVESKGVNFEVNHWLEHRSEDTLLVAVTGGRWVWSDELGDFEPGTAEDPSAVPLALRGRLSGEPVHVDLSWVAESPSRQDAVDPENARLRDDVARIAATILGVEPGQLIGEDWLQFKRAQRIRRITAAVLVALALAVVGLVVLLQGAVAGREEAVGRADTEESRRLARDLALRALNADNDQPDTRILTAVAADQIDSTGASQGALLRALLETPDLTELLPGHNEGVVDLKRSADGTSYASVDGTGALRWWSADGTLLAGPIDVTAVDVLLSEDGTTMASVDRGGHVRWFSLPDGDESYDVEPPQDATVDFGCDAWGCGRPFSGISPDGGTVALAMRLADGRDVVQFAGPDQPTTEIDVGQQVTGILWHGRDPLFVADLEGIRRWNGAEGPSGEYLYRFGSFAGIIPGQADYKTNGTLETPLSGSAITLVTLWPAGEYEVVFIHPETGEHLGSTSAHGFTDDVSSRAPLAAVASSWPGQVWMATDPQEGAGPVPLIIDAAVPSYRGLRTRWNLPRGAVTRLVAGEDNVVAVGGLDPVVRVIGGTDGIVRYSITDMEEAPVLLADPVAVEHLPGVVNAEQGLSYATEPLNHAYAAGIYARDGTSFGDSVGDDGPLRVVDANGGDITPAEIRDVNVSSVVIDGENGLLYTGDRSGAIDKTDLATGESADSSRVLNRPILGMKISHDGNFLLVASDEELVIVDPTTLNVVQVLIAVETSSYVVDSLFLSPSITGTGSGFDADGNLWFGWLKSVGTEMGFGSGPFGVDEAVGALWLPGVDTLSDYAPSVVLILDDLIERGCHVANRDMTDAEWDVLAPGTERPDVCPDNPMMVESPGPPLERFPEDG